MRYRRYRRYTFLDAVSILAIVAVLVSLASMILREDPPKLAEGVMEVKQVTCENSNTDEEAGHVDCTLLVRVPGNPVVKDRNYIRVLEPGEELAPEEEEG